MSYRTLAEFFEDKWLQLGIRTLRDPHGYPARDILARTEWCETFVNWMVNRLILGPLRYGRNYYPGKKHWDRVGRIRKELALYEADGNIERLVDIANMALLEFAEGEHPHRHFEAHDDGLHTEEKKA